uniref:mamu class II histocompatibility antigen, DR alpha chain-like n=1 Tax=Euleptes europaea TaxID=460621 RepID=UPI002540AEF9|nr:mamu class II histocompatibility antigen, DR alpha chain-like [Euleptes europaea]
MGGLAGYLGLLLPLLGGRLVPAEDVMSFMIYAQRSLSSEKGPGEYIYEVNGDEFFHVDLEHKETVWRLPQFPDGIVFQGKVALPYMASLRGSLDNFMRRSNNTPTQNVPPKVTVYPEKPVTLGELNVLICLANEFSPPVIRLTWLKNGQEVKDGVEETVFYPSTDYSFRKFSYLTFIPNAEDIYYCRVEHEGLAQPLTREWNADMDKPLPETAENVVCGLGLVVGIVGIIVGIVFTIKSRQMNEANLRNQGQMCHSLPVKICACLFPHLCPSPLLSWQSLSSWREKWGGGHFPDRCGPSHQNGAHTEMALQRPHQLAAQEGIRVSPLSSAPKGRPQRVASSSPRWTLSNAFHFYNGQV